MKFTEALPTAKGAWITRAGYSIRQVWLASEVPPQLISQVASLPFWIKMQEGEITVHHLTKEELEAEDWSVV